MTYAPLYMVFLKDINCVSEDVLAQKSILKDWKETEKFEVENF